MNIDNNRNFVALYTNTNLVGAFSKQIFLKHNLN